MIDLQERYRAEIIAGWVAATDRAILALQGWRGRLVAWGNGGLVSRADLQAALELLSAQGLDDWAEWGAAAGSLDDLAEVIGGGAVAEPQ